jgi:UDP-glucose 4-epimerase
LGSAQGGPSRQDDRVAGERYSEVVEAINTAVPGADISLPEGHNPDRPPGNYLDTTRLRTDTGFRPQ